MRDELRREQIRAASRSGAAAAQELRDQFTDTGLQELARLTVFWFQDAATVFANDAEQNRSDAAEARWLENAENVLHMAKAQLNTLLQMKQRGAR